MKARILVQVGIFQKKEDQLRLLDDPKNILSEVMQMDHDFVLKAKKALDDGTIFMLEFEAITKY